LTYDFKIGYKPFSSLVELIEVHANLKELGEFEKEKTLKQTITNKILCNIFNFFTQVCFYFSIIF